MSKSVRDQSVCNRTGFTAKANSEQGISRQNIRLGSMWALRLFLIGSLFLAFPATSHAQPPWTDPGTVYHLTDIGVGVGVGPNVLGNWAVNAQTAAVPGPPAGGPAWPQGAPYQYLFTRHDNWTGFYDRWTASTVTLYGSVRGGTAYNAAANNRYGHWWVGTAEDLQYDTLYGTSTLNVQGGANIRQLTQLTVQGSLVNSGDIHSIGGYDYSYGSIYGTSVYGYVGIHVMGSARNNAGARIGGTGNEYVDFMSVAQTLFNSGPSTTAGRAEITNVHEIQAGSLINHGIIQQTGSNAISSAYITVASDLVNGSNYATYGGTTRQRRDAEIVSNYGNYGGLLFITVGGNLVQYYDGSIRANGGIFDVGGELYNCGEIRVNEGITAFYSSNWLIRAGSVYNDGRLWDQVAKSGGNYPSSAWSGQAWGAIYDAQINTIGNLVNIGANAVMNASVNSDMNMVYLGGDVTRETLNSMHVGGDLFNLDRASIFNYSDIVVHGSLHNRGATLVGGHWFRHSNLTDKWEHPMVTQMGNINVWGNVYNTTEEPYIASEGRYGGLIASFDNFYVHGSLFNDANSMITGTYTHVETGAYGNDGAKYGTWNGGDTIYGRRASVLGGALVDGTYDDAASVLTVKGVFSDSQPGQPPFYGIYNEGHIREIDIIHVGSDENGVLWNAFSTLTPGAMLPTSNGQLTFEGPVGTPGTITDIGIINATNLINSGTISDIDSAINVSYALWNDMGGVLDGYSASHVEWSYDIDGTPMWDFLLDDDTGLLTWQPPQVFQETRAILRVGKATEANLYVPVDIGIYNSGTITNFESITSQGDVYNDGMISNTSSLTIGNNVLNERANFYNMGILQNIGSVYVSGDMQSYGMLMNIEGVRVSGDLLLGMGSSFGNVGTLAAQKNVVVEGMVDGGFNVLAAETGGVTVGSTLMGIPGFMTGGALTVDRGATVSGNLFIENYGTIVNNGVVNSALSIENWGIFTNNGVASAYNIFRNQGQFSGTGVVNFSANNGIFDNISGGVITGGHVINGNFRNNNGDIVATPNAVIRVVNGTAVVNRGTVDGSMFVNPEVGKQYLFLATDKPGDLFVDRELTGVGNGTTGSVLDFSPVYGAWNGFQYVPGKEWSRNNQYYWLEVKRAYSYGDHAVTPNQIAVGNYIDTIGVAPVRDGGLWNLLQQLDGISDDPTHRDSNGVSYYHPDYRQHQGLINPAALKALDELSGMIYANLGTASVHNTGVVNRTLADVLRSDVFKFSYIGNPNNAIRGQAIAPLRYTRWGTLFGIGGNTLHDGNADGYKTTFGGVMAGFDRALWTGTRVGAYLAAGVGDVTMRNLDESSDITSAAVGMYLRQEMFYGYGLATAGFGADWYDTERNLTMINHRAEGKTHAKIGTAYLERGIDIPVYYATLQPYTSFQVVSVHQNKFTERMWNQQGQYSDVGLEGVKGQTDSFKLALGARAATQPIPLPWAQLALTTNMAWFHDFNGKQDRDYIARFANPGGSSFGTQFSDLTFRIDGNDPKRDWFNFGLGLNMDRNSTRVFLGADLYANNRQTLFSGNLGFNTSW